MFLLPISCTCFWRIFPFFHIFKMVFNFLMSFFLFIWKRTILLAGCMFFWMKYRVYQSSIAASLLTGRNILLPNSIRNERSIELLGFHLLQEFTKTHTYSSLGKSYKISVETVKNYLMYFERAFNYPIH